jgi:hypothetical protein
MPFRSDAIAHIYPVHFLRRREGALLSTMRIQKLCSSESTFTWVESDCSSSSSSVSPRLLYAFTLKCVVLEDPLSGNNVCVNWLHHSRFNVFSLVLSRLLTHSSQIRIVYRLIEFSSGVLSPIKRVGPMSGRACYHRNPCLHSSMSVKKEEERQVQNLQ